MSKKSRFVLIYLFLALVAILLLSHVFQKGVFEIKYSEFRDYLARGYISELKLGNSTITGKILIPSKIPPQPAIKNVPPVEPVEPAAAEKPKRNGDSGEERGIFSLPKQEIPLDRKVSFSTGRVADPELVKILESLSVDYESKPESDFGVYISILLPILILLGFWFLIFRQSQAGRAALAFGRSKARLYAEKVKSVTFDDVAGCDEAKEELKEVVDFLKSPKKYQTLGGRMPKGVLLVGPPGTGKTLIARAVAGEAKRPFFSLSGSEFVEMFVGVGAARVRDLFQQAKDSAPCIIFIDELDAVGRHRGAGLGGGHDEREQTLNQLLVEMDGFDANAGVIILAATNRPDVLDPALLRPGRFDRQVVIDAPDLRGREEILKVHARNKPLALDVDLRGIAASTPGFTGADLANVLNEAALLAARREHEQIGRDDLQEATERVIAGPERKSRRLGEEERRRVAYHEAGHALVATLSENADPVRKISIIPRGHAALGYTMQFPTDDRYLITRNALLDRLKSLLAGRAAEELIFNEISTGAQDDLSKASEITRSMVCRFGMSDKIGPVTLGREQRQIFLGRDIGQEERNYSEATAVEIDREVRRIIEEADHAAVDTLKKYRACLEHVAETLLAREVLQGDELEAILEHELCALGVSMPRRKKGGEKPSAGETAEPKGAEKPKPADAPLPDPAQLKQGWAHS